jgi:hypothetical protein
MDILKQFIDEQMKLFNNELINTLYTIVYITVKELTKYNKRRDALVHKKLDKIDAKMKHMNKRFKNKLRRLLRGAYVKTNDVIECEATPEYKS